MDITKMFTRRIAASTIWCLFPYRIGSLREGHRGVQMLVRCWFMVVVVGGGGGSVVVVLVLLFNDSLSFKNFLFFFHLLLILHLYTLHNHFLPTSTIPYGPSRRDPIRQGIKHHTGKDCTSCWMFVFGCPSFRSYFL